MPNRIAVRTALLLGAISFLALPGVARADLRFDRTLTNVNVPLDMVSADFDQDGRTDVAVMHNASAGGVTILRNVAGATANDVVLTPLTALATLASPLALRTGDFDEDGRPDLVLAHGPAGNSTLYLNRADGWLRRDVNLNSNPQLNVAVGDINKDGNLDLVYSVSGAFRYYRGDGAGNFVVQQTFGLPGAGFNPFYRDLEVGDINTDGNPDLVVINQNGNAAAVVLGNGTAFASFKGWYATGTTPLEVSLGDYNGDGRLDAAVANSVGNSVSILAGQADGGLTALSTPITGAGPNAIASDDLNGDGRLDFLTAGTGMLLRLGDGDGTFRPGAPYPTDGTAYAALTVDMNKDGRLDFVAPDLTGNSVALFLRNVGTLSFSGKSAQPLAPEATRQYTANEAYSDGTDRAITGDLLWTTSDPAVATVTQGGRVTAVAAGQATISARLDGVTHAVETVTVPACTKTGTAGNDNLTGTAGVDIICGLGGNDTLIGLEGDDVLLGGPGKDTLLGGRGTDTLSGGADADTAGFYDSAISGVAIDLEALTVSGGGAGGDTLSGIENVDGSPGDDSITGSTAANVLDGRGGSDTIHGGDGNDTLIGGAGNDTLRGESGNDQVQPGAGADDAAGGESGETFFGDVIRYTDATAAVTVDLADNSTGGAAAGDVIADFESAYGSPFDDRLSATLDGVASLLTGNNGDDELATEDADDIDSIMGGNHVNGDGCVGSAGDVLVTCNP